VTEREVRTVMLEQLALFWSQLFAGSAALDRNYFLSVSFVLILILERLMRVLNKRVINSNTTQSLGHFSVQLVCFYWCICVATEKNCLVRTLV